jgi:hypothetical protein
MMTNWQHLGLLYQAMQQMLIKLLLLEMRLWHAPEGKRSKYDTSLGDV